MQRNQQLNVNCNNDQFNPSGHQQKIKYKFCNNWTNNYHFRPSWHPSFHLKYMHAWTYFMKVWDKVPSFQAVIYMKTCQCGLHLSLCILTIIVNYLVWMKSIQVGIDLYSFEKICVNLRSSEAIPQLTSIYQITWTLQGKTNITQYY